MIPVFNCADFLPETLISVLAQALPADQMQIEVVDDASSDTDVKEMVERIGKGRISYFRHPSNVGSLKNFETCINRARGELVHLLHGDDVVRSGYYAKITSLFEKHPEIGAAFCRYEYIDEHSAYLWGQDIEAREEGVLDNWLMRIARKQRIQYCAITVKREVYEKLGGFYGVIYGEDWEMWARIAVQYKVAYTPEVLARYRLHSHSVSSRSFADAQNIRDINWVVSRIQDYVPDSERETVRKEAFRDYAHYALSIANSLWHVTHSKENVKLQIREALRMHTDLGMYYKAAKIYTKMIVNRR
jgi:glycosyltransferase involved in cell wall biosynthesis